MCFLLYCRPPEFTVIQTEMYTAGGPQSGHTVNLIYLFTHPRYPAI